MGYIVGAYGIVLGSLAVLWVTTTLRLRRAQQRMDALHGS